MEKKIKMRVLQLAAAMLLTTQIIGCGAFRDGSAETQAGNQTADMAENAETDRQDVIQAAQHLITVWSDYMDVLEKMYASQLWALDYVDAYMESSDWGDLTRARTACIASARYLQELSMVEDDLSEGEYLILANAGIDTTYQSGELASASVFLESAHSFIRNQMLANLESNIYYESYIETMKGMVSTERDAISAMCRYTCAETNYLLLTLGDMVDPEGYWTSMKDQYPVLTSECPEWSDSEAELEAAAEACIDAYEEAVVKQPEYVSMLEADLCQMAQAIEDEDLDTLAASTHVMSNVPKLLPFPEWYDPNTTGYLNVVIGDDESVTYPESGDDLTGTESVVYMRAEHVGEEEVAAYIEKAELFAQDVWRSVESGAWFIQMPDYVVKLACEDDTATIYFSGEDVTFAPIWCVW